MLSLCSPHYIHLQVYPRADFDRNIPGRLWTHTCESQNAEEKGGEGMKLKLEENNNKSVNVRIAYQF
jgi:hypothetical protein